MSNNEDVEKLELVLEQARLTYASLEAANRSIEAKAWQMAGLTAAIGSIVIPKYLDYAEGCWIWGALSIFIGIFGAACLLESLNQARPRKFSLPTLNTETHGGEYLLRTHVFPKQYDELLTDTLMSYTDPVDGESSPLHELAMANKKRSDAFDTAAGLFLVFAILATFGAAFAALSSVIVCPLA